MAVLAGIEGGWRALRASPPGTLAARLDSVLLLALIVTSAGGLGILVGGNAPANSLHYVYTVVALGVLPIISSLTKRLQPRIRGAATFVGALVVLVVIARLFQTG